MTSFVGKRIFGTPNGETLTGTDFGDEIYGYAGNDVLRGGRHNDRLYGGDNNDKLYGEEGEDWLEGGKGDDTYYLDVDSDRVIERFGEGKDTVWATLSSYTLEANVEDLYIVGMIGSGNGLDNTIQGFAENNKLMGYGGNDYLIGGYGKDDLYGGIGNDTLDGNDLVIQSIADWLEGGKDDDYYYVDLLDYVHENLNEGTDTVEVSNNVGRLQQASYTLGAHVENLILTDLVLTGIGNELDNVITDRTWLKNTLRGMAGDDTLVGNGGDDLLEGGADNDELYGGADNDTLDGGTGDDAMFGGTGNDTYRVDSAGDIVSENAGGGTDTVESSRSYTLGANVENLTLAGNAIMGIGNNLNNTIVGNGIANNLKGEGGNDIINGGDGADTLDGGLGMDWLIGGRGADTMTGGTGTDSDRFRFLSVDDSLAYNGRFNAKTGDTIKAFQAGVDKIDLNPVDANSRLDGNQDFHFNSDIAKFNGTAGQVAILSYRDVSGWVNTVFADTNGDDVSEMAFMVLSTARALNASDFLL